MSRRAVLLILASFSALTLPLAARVFTTRADAANESEKMAIMLRQRGYREVGEIERRGDVFVVLATSRSGQRRRLVVTPDGTIVGDRALP